MAESTDKPRSSKLPWVLWCFTLLAVAAGAYLAWGRVGDEARQRDAALQAADEAAGRARTEKVRADALQQKLDDAEKERAALADKADELSSTLEAKEAELKRLTATYEALEDKMKEEIKKGDIRLSQSGGRIQVDLVDKILFDSAKAEVTPRGAEVLARLGAVLASMEERQIQVSGHTDDSPITLPDLQAKFPSNWELSAARAVNVVRFLAESAKVPPGRLIAAGHGQYHPIATNATPKGRALNRRIELLLLPALEARKAGPLPAPDAGPKKGGK